MHYISVKYYISRLFNEFSKFTEFIETVKENMKNSIPNSYFKKTLNLNLEKFPPKIFNKTIYIISPVVYL